MFEGVNTKSRVKRSIFKNVVSSAVSFPVITHHEVLSCVAGMIHDGHTPEDACVLGMIVRSTAFFSPIRRGRVFRCIVMDSLVSRGRGTSLGPL